MKTVSLLFLLACGAMAQMGPGMPAMLQIQTFPMVGVAEGQTARLSVLNPGVQAPAATGALCSGLLSFLDDQGTVLKSSAVTVAPGKAMSIDLDSDIDLKLAVNTRKQIRATVQVPPAVPPAQTPVGFCTLAPTLEIFDKLTARTQVLLVETRMIPQVLMGLGRP